MSVAFESRRAKGGTASQAAALRFSRVTPVLGAEVTGVDLGQELDADTVAALRQGLLRHKVLYFRDQKITDAQQVRFTRYFGAVTPGPGPCPGGRSPVR